MNPFLYINMKLLTSAAVMLRSIFITLYNFCHSFNCRGNSYKTLHLDNCHGLYSWQHGDSGVTGECDGDGPGDDVRCSESA